ncbi:MAG TPA: 5-formyltetrahydrofolate cyclo-ligase [Candidatus Saccharimonadales bacterium]|nr:5-formyltetrahydrofolate cyclo-ligase [Candidatus Saccharimonadales bacterium]
MNKTQLREWFRAKLAAQSATEREQASRVIIGRLLASEEYARAGTIFTYVTTPQEVDTRGLIEQAWRDGKQVAVPRLEDDRIVAKCLTAWEELQPGLFSIPEPGGNATAIDTSNLDLILVPGLAFTCDGARLGHGRGHFDRWLATLPPSTPTVGLAFAFQLVDELPHEPHDICIQKVLTNSYSARND